MKRYLMIFAVLAWLTHCDWGGRDGDSTRGSLDPYTARWPGSGYGPFTLEVIPKPL
jgi:hypothetical protein